MPSKTTSSDIITQLQAYNKDLKELHNTSLFDVEQYISMFRKFDEIKLSNAEAQDKQKQLDEVQKDFNELYKQSQVNKTDYDKKIKDIQQQKQTYIDHNLSKDTDTNKLIDVLKSGVLDYKYAVKLIKDNNDIKQRIRDGKYVIARQGNRVALIAVDKNIVGATQELTNFLQQQDNTTISNVILSNVPVYNDVSPILSFDKDVQDLSDDVLKIYFSVENNSKVDFVADVRKTELYSNVVEDIIKRLIDHQKNTNNKKINVQIEGSSYGIYPLLTGLLSVKKHNTQQCLSLSNCHINLSMIPRSILNGITPEMTAEKIDKLFQWAIEDGYHIDNKNISFVNLDVLSNDNFGRFEYHNVSSTNSFLKELSRLQTAYNHGRADKDKQTLLVAVNEDMQPVVKESVGWLTGTAKQDLFKNIASSDSEYSGIAVKTMSDVANDIKRESIMHNKTAGISKNNKDGISHNVNDGKATNNGSAKSAVVDGQTIQKV